MRFLNGRTTASFCLFLLFSSTKLTEKTVGFSGIQTQIVTVEGEHADHKATTSTAYIIVFEVWHLTVS